MRTEHVEFYSEGVRLRGILRLPDGEPLASGFPALVHGPGLLGHAAAEHYLPYHQAFTDAGYAVLVFDYRGYGESDGERGWLRPDWQVEDICNAVTYLETREEIDSRRIGAYGMGGTGGGNAVMAAGLDSRIRCVCAQTSVSDGEAWLRRLRRQHEWVELKHRLAADRRRWVLEGTGERVEPGQLAIPDRPAVNPKAKPIQGVPELFLRSVEYVTRYRPIDVVSKIAPRALLLSTIEDDPITPEDLIEEMFRRAGGPKKLIRQLGVEHYATYTVNFPRLSTHFVEWYDRYLKPAPFDRLPEPVEEVVILNPEVSGGSGH